MTNLKFFHTDVTPNTGVGVGPQGPAAEFTTRPHVNFKLLKRTTGPNQSNEDQVDN